MYRRKYNTILKRRSFPENHVDRSSLARRTNFPDNFPGKCAVRVSISSDEAEVILGKKWIWNWRIGVG